ncbi:MAG TPA: type II secretion system secretin GspD [Stellaceae bacterium]|jgi:general secretion pathway protein D
MRFGGSAATARRGGRLCTAVTATAAWLGVALLAGCGIEQVREVPLPQVPPPLAQGEPAPTAPGPAGRPPAPIAIGPQRGEEARSVPRQPLFAGGARAVAPSSSSPAAAAAPRPAGDITLNFEDTDIREVVGAVLRDILKRNYAIDPDVQGTVTLSVSQPLAQDQVLPILEALLNSRGATMVEADGLIRVVPLREGGKRMLGRGSGGLPGQRLQVIAPRFMTPTELQHLIEPTLPAGSVLLADDARNVLLVQGSAQDIAAARQVVDIFDIDKLAGTQIAMVLLQNADATTVLPELNAMFGAARKAADTNVIRFIPVERLNAIIVLSREPRYIEEAQSWISRLDKVRRINEPQLYVYYVQHGKAADVARTLQGAFSRNAPPPAETGQQPAAPAGSPDLAPSPLGTITGAPAGVVQPGSALPGYGDAFSADSQTEPGGGAMARPRAAPPNDAAAAAAAGQTPDTTGPRIRADEANNSLLIMATPREYAQVQQVLDQIDIPPLQVLIEATLAEVVLDNGLQYGVEYFLNSGNFGTLLTTGAVATGITPAVPGFSAFYQVNGNARALIQALSTQTETTLLSTPRLFVLDNQTARLQVGDVVPIVTQTATSTLTATPLTVNAIQYRDTGVVLEVTPRVNASGFVTLGISQSVSDVVRTTTSNIDSPTIRQRRIRSEIGVQSGETILLGGLIRDDGSKSDSGIPYLHAIPILGTLFGNRNDTATRTELIVLLTPRVVHNPQEASDLTREIGRKFQSVLLMQDELRVTPRPPR